MKNLLLITSLSIVIFLSCTNVQEHPSSHRPDNTKYQNGNDDSDAPSPNEEPSKPKLKEFSFDAYKSKYSASMNEDGSITILNYPLQWHGNAWVARFDGQHTDYQPFSHEHCEEITSLAQNGAWDLVSSGYHSALIFELPPFLTSDFEELAYRAAEAHGLHSFIVEIKNKIDEQNGVLTLSLKRKSLAQSSKYPSAIRQQLDLSQKGMMIDNMHKLVPVTSGDIICDLRAGRASIQITYPLKGEEKSIDIIYDLLETRASHQKCKELSKSSNEFDGYRLATAYDTDAVSLKLQNTSKNMGKKNIDTEIICYVKKLSDEN